MLERLPTPWGLVRLGVAPDHPKIKAVSKAFERIAAQPGFRFLGGVEVGRDLTHDDLVELYDAVVYAVGAQTDRRMGIPGEDLPGSWAATEFVAWYNGHPDYQELVFDLSGERAVVVGAGNVALDVVRMLALAPEEIRPTDTTDEAIEAILGSGLEEIVLLARRGPAQAAFTTPELKELGELADADVLVDPAELELDPASEASLEHDTNARRNVEVLREYAQRPSAGKRRAIRLRFCVSPVAIVGDGRVEGIEVVRNRLVADDSGRVSAEPTDERETIPCGIVFRSVGYLGVELPGVPFDARRATIPNENGRVAAVSRGLLRRLDQARPERGDRHEQEGRDGDRRPPARRRACRTAAAGRSGGDCRDGGAAARRPRRRARHLCRLGGDRLRGARPRRAGRPPSREARHLERPARRGSLQVGPDPVGARPAKASAVLTHG